MERLIRIYVDFNLMMMDEMGRIPIKQKEFPSDKENAIISPVTGIPIVLYDEEIEVDAKLFFDKQLNLWMAYPDWATIRDL